MIGRSRVADHEGDFANSRHRGSREVPLRAIEPAIRHRWLTPASKNVPQHISTITRIIHLAIARDRSARMLGRVHQDENKRRN